MTMNIEQLTKYYENTDFDSIINGYHRQEYIRYFLLKSICKWWAFKEFNKYGSKPVDGNLLPDILASWKQKLHIEKNHEFERLKLETSSGVFLKI